MKTVATNGMKIIGRQVRDQWCTYKLEKKGGEKDVL